MTKIDQTIEVPPIPSTIAKETTARRSVYALTPDKRWTTATEPLLAAFLIVVLFLGAISFIPSLATFGDIRGAFTLLSVQLLMYRLIYYADHQWLLYFLDFCYWVHYWCLWALWGEGLGTAGHPNNFAIAMFASSVGPVGGAAFMLQTPLTLHHPEAFETFNLHVVPMWIAYCVRWRWGAVVLTETVPVSRVIWLGFSKIYVPWALLYLAFLTVKPYTPLAKYSTLFDWYVYGNTAKPAVSPPFFSWAWKPAAYIFIHMLLSLEGYAAAALSFQYQLVNQVWLFMVFLGTCKCGYLFYYKSAHPEYHEGNKIVAGLRDSCIAWAVVLPTYLYCNHFYPHS